MWTVLLLGGPWTAFAQSADEPALRAHRFTAGGGVVWTGGYDIGGSTAELRGNAVGASAPPFVLFHAATRVDAAAGVDARIGYTLTRAIALELGASFARPGLTTRVSQDPEAAATALDAERLSEYVVDVGVVWQVPRVRLIRRGRAFVTAGGGYLRQLYDARTLVETGHVLYAGGGLRYWLRGGDRQHRSVGLRTEVRARWRSGGAEFEGRTRLLPVVVAHVFAEF
jgi:hypothetical protein